MAVGAPGAADGDDDDLVAELGIGVGNLLTGEVGEGESERSRGVLDAGLLSGFSGRRKIQLAGVGGTASDQVAGLSFLCLRRDEVGDEEGAIGLRGEGVECGAGGGEVADGVLMAVP